MRDITQLGNKHPAHAEGRVCIELKDPITGKVRHRVEGKNHIFPQSLLCGPSRNWVTGLSQAYLELTDNDEDIDTTFPYMIGNTIGYGIPSTGSSGLYRGAYSVANQVLAQKNGLTSLRWKFQYDFTTGQANGAIKRIGLTSQYSANSQLSNSMPNGVLTSSSDSCCDGRYRYSISSVTGIVEIYDLFLNTTTTVDLSATVGTVSTNYKNVGYAPTNGKFYIYVYSTTTSNRKMYVYSDSTFTTLETTYTPTNLDQNQLYPFYVYGNYAFFVGGNAIYISDFVNNVAYTTLYVTTYATTRALPTGTNITYNNYNNIGYQKYIMSCGDRTGTFGFIFDMSTQTFVGALSKPSTSSSTYGVSFFDQTLTERIFCYTYATDLYCCANPAIAMKKLDTPVTKTSANGMTVTYEVEVFW